MNHFLEISQLSRQQIESIVQRALYFKQHNNYPSYPQHTVAHLFYENSTRTRVSFELAANRLSMPVINLDLQNSSETKGEVIEDTIRTLAAFCCSRTRLTFNWTWEPRMVGCTSKPFLISCC